MRYILLVLTALTLSCGSVQHHNAATNHLVMKCRLFTACLPPIELHGMSPDEFCDWLEDLGDLGRYMSEQECNECQAR